MRGTAACAVVAFALALGYKPGSVAGAQGDEDGEAEAASTTAAPLGPEHGEGCTPVSIATPATLADYDLDVTPVLLRGFKAAKKPSKWTLKGLTKRFGNKYIAASRWTSFFETFGGDTFDPITFADFAAEIVQQEDAGRFESYACFDGTLHDMFKKTLNKEVAVPKPFKAKFKELADNPEIRQKKPHRILSIARGPGFAMHVHGSAVFALVHGEAKLWRLIEPETAAKLGVSMLSVNFNKLRTNATMSRDAGGFCVEQLPGDVLYVPAGWYHGTFNRGITIGVSIMASMSETQMTTNAEAMLAANKNSFDGHLGIAQGALTEAKGMIGSPYPDMQEEQSRLEHVAIAAANRAIEMWPQDVRPYFYLCQIYRNLQYQYDLAAEAIMNGTKALDLFLPEGSSGIGGPDGEFRNAAAVSRERDSTLLKFGKELDLSGNFDGALALFNTVLANNPDSNTVKLQMAQTLAEANSVEMDFSASLKLLDEVIANAKSPTVIEEATNIRNTIVNWDGPTDGDEGEQTPAMGLGEGDAGMPDDAHVMSPDEVPEHIRRGGGGSDEL